MAVVGAGAAGVSAAAAVALLSTANVDLYERADEILPLQRASIQRRLDPHIYSWPAFGSDDPIADLPILDWTAGSARDVRADVKAQFEDILAALPGRIRVNCRHEVTASRIVGDDLQLDFRRDPPPGQVGDGPDNRLSGQGTFDLIILAFGFGLEAPSPIAGVQSQSYWSDASVPVAEFAGRPTPRFLVSGNGDGGLIDLVAAASGQFDHAGMIREIVRQPGIQGLYNRLEAIDDEARAAKALGNGFDFLSRYDAELGADLEGLGLLELVRGRLRPGVQLVLQTLKAEAFIIETATLNRLAAYLVIRACQTSAQTTFTHVYGDDLRVVAAPPAPAYQAPFWFECGGTRFGVDAPILRHGPGRAAARAPFTELLGEFDLVHKRWLAIHGDAVRVPTLPAAADQELRAAARRTNLPLARYRQQQLQQQQPRRIRVQPHGGGLRWSGDVAPAGIGTAWDTGTPELDIYVPNDPNTLAPLSAALLRLAVHNSRITLVTNPAAWRPFADPLTMNSAHAEHLALPAFRAGVPAGAGQNALDASAAELASRVHAALNAWILAAIDQHVRVFAATGRDPGNAIGFSAAFDLRSRIGGIWDQWLPQLRAEPQLLDRFLRLMVSADDPDDDQDHARVVVGRRKLPAIIRGAAAALAVASAWPTTGPRAAKPGNLGRSADSADVKTGHVCAADLIAREPTAIAAAAFVWRTNFIVLSQLVTPIALTSQAEVGLGDVDQGQPGLADRSGAGGLVLTLDQRFRQAARTGLAALTMLLDALETEHFESLAKAIVKETA